MTTAVKGEEVAEVLRKVIRGEVPIRLANPALTWNWVWCGNCEFLIGDWRMTFFNDCGELDYTDHVVAPDGRKTDYDDFYEAGDGVELLSDEERACLVAIFEAVK